MSTEKDWADRRAIAFVKTYLEHLDSDSDDPESVVKQLAADYRRLRASFHIVHVEV